MKSIVEQVAAEIAEIPGMTTADVIARVAIEAYQRVLWQPRFDDHAPLAVDLRRGRADKLTHFIVGLASSYMDDQRAVREFSHALFSALYETGAEVITDVDRATAGLKPRNEYGLTVDEMQAIEAKRLEVMRAPIALRREFE